ncbi:MAG: LysR family transcriptional regulator [Thioploca sp.]|nr:LysR family transcriptional regulator [Thioploca sp.]
MKTFLEVERTRHFGRAANNLYLTQSAVSARIRLLEETLGVALFTRHRHNIQLTPKGKCLVKHAHAVLSAWARACQDLALDDDEGQRPALLRIGGIFSLWEIILQDWIHTIYQQISPLVIQTEVENLECLLRKLSAGVLDIGFLFDPPPVLELITQSVSQIKLRLVSSQPGLSVEQALSGNYVSVDWGTRFATFQAQLLPPSPPPVAQMALGSLALAFIRHRSGSSYLPETLCKTLLDNGQLFLVTDAPIFDHNIYALYTRQNTQLALIENVLSYFSLIIKSYPLKSFYLEQ